MKKLTRDEMKNVTGGKLAGGGSPGCMTAASSGTSCWHNADWSSFECNLTQSQAQAHGGSWCTASCSSSCYNNGAM